MLELGKLVWNEPESLRVRARKNCLDKLESLRVRTRKTCLDKLENLRVRTRRLAWINLRTCVL